MWVLYVLQHVLLACLQNIEKHNWTFAGHIVLHWTYVLFGWGEWIRNGMKFNICYGQLFKNFITPLIPFPTPYTRSHTLNLRRNAPFSPILDFFSNLIITILHSLIYFQNFPPISNILLYFHSFPPFSPTKHNLRYSATRLPT